MSHPKVSSRLFVNGSVYSASDPFATALLVEGANVSWLGSDQAARIMAGPHAEVTDLQAAVVTPAFVAHQWVEPGTDLVSASQGYAAVELLGADAAAVGSAAKSAEDHGLIALPVLVQHVASPEALQAVQAPRQVLGADLTSAADEIQATSMARDHLLTCTAASFQAVLIVGREGDPAPSWAVDAVLAALDDVTAQLGERTVRARGHRVVGVGELNEDQCNQLSRHAISITAEAGAAPLADLARVGVSVTIASAAPNPWSAVKAVLEAERPSHRISARAAFLAMTRGAWRAQRDISALAGQLAPGAEATMAVWDVASLMVQQPEGTGASWSTDPRGRTPALPALDEAQLPACEETWVRGVKVT